MLRAYRELKFLWIKMREVRRLPEEGIPEWSKRTADEWAYLHLPHY